MSGLPAHRRRGRVRRLLTGPVGRTALTLAVVVVVFVGVLPRISGYAAAWDLVRSMSPLRAAVVAGVALVNLVSYAPLEMAALPGLTLGRAVLSDLAPTAIANTVPAGFAFGVGTNAAMYHSFGFSAGEITRGLALTGVWNNLVKLAMPAFALAGLAVVGDVDRGLAVAAVIGSGVLLLAVAALVLLAANERAARALGRVAERLVGRLCRAVRRRPPSGWAERAERFREESRDLVAAHWPRLTATAVASHVALFLVLLACLWAVGGEGAGVSWVVVLAVFSITRLITLVPITPGAMGVAELSYVAGLTAGGVDAATATGAVLLFRFLTWFLPIPAGVAAWLLWRRGVGRTDAAEPVGSGR